MFVYKLWTQMPSPQLWTPKEYGAQRSSQHLLRIGDLLEEKLLFLRKPEQSSILEERERLTGFALRHFSSILMAFLQQP